MVVRFFFPAVTMKLEYQKTNFVILKRYLRWLVAVLGLKKKKKSLVVLSTAQHSMLFIIQPGICLMGVPFTDVSF